jgi:N-acyl-phosphatidylethanolamine-hydrolysing phospholipase D
MIAILKRFRSAVRIQWLLVAIFIIAFLLLLPSCTTVNPYYNAAKPHHRPGGFQNNYVEFEPKNFFTDVLLGWQLPSALKGLPPRPQSPTPSVAPDLAFIQANGKAGAAMQPAITFIGHATMLAQVPTATGGLNLITDPIFSERASPVGFAGPRRSHPPGLVPADLPTIDVVLISHNHYDHLDEASVKALNAQAGGPPLFVVPLGLKPWLAERGITRAVELDWWDSHTVAGAEIMLTPVQHWSGRGLNDRLTTLWGGFAVLSPAFHLFYPGDTGYSKDFKDIRQRLASRQGAAQGGGFDIALLPVGGYEPRWFMQQQHVNPAEAVQIHRDLGAKRSAGLHWGSFELTDEALDQPPRDLAAARRAQGVADEAFVVTAIGETRRLPRRSAPAGGAP